MASHISINWPLKEALFKLLYISSQNALICIFSRVYQFWNKNRVLNYAMNYERPFCVGTWGYMDERDRKTTHKLSSQETEKAGGRTEVKKSRASTWPQEGSRDMLTVWPSRAFLQYSQMFLPPKAVMCAPHSRLPQTVNDKRSLELRMSKILILVFAVKFDKLYFGCLFISGVSISLALK